MGVARVEAVLDYLGIDHRVRHGRAWAKCPYHDDKNPSWCVNCDPDDYETYGLHHCFSCGAGGTLAELVEHVRGITNGHMWLAEFEEKLEVEKVDLPSKTKVHVAPPRLFFERPREMIVEPFDKWVTLPKKYLENRRIGRREVSTFGIGYAVEGRLAGRIIIPTIHAKTRKMANYMARDFTESKRAKRYLFPFEEDRPDNDVMFGEHTWHAPGWRRRIYVTEGAFNAVSIYQARDMRDDIAALGSSSTVREAHLGKLATFENVIVVADNDKASQLAASQKVLGQIALALGRHTKVSACYLPEGTDANSMELEDLTCALRSTVPVT